MSRTPDTGSEAGAAAGRPSELDLLVPEIPWLGVALARPSTRRILRANATFLEIVGRDARDLEGEGLEILAITEPGSAETTIAAIETLRATRRMAPVEKRYVRPDGSIRWGWVTGTMVPGDDDRIVVYVLDVTDQRSTYDALRESEERARRLAEASFEGLLVHVNGDIVDVNDVLPAMLRTTREALLGRHVTELTDPSCHPALLDRIARRYELPYELIGRRDDGTTFPVEVVGKPLPTGGRPLRVVAVRDLTERKLTEAALRDAESALQRAQKLESLGLLAGGVAHDFNNLLAIITSFAAIAQRHVPAGSPANDALLEIDRAARRAGDLTRQMLVYSGRSPKHIGPLALDDVVAEMTRLVTASFSKKIEVDVSLAEHLPEIAADRAQIEQVLVNLMTNAAESIGDARGSIRVSTAVVDVGPREVASPTPGEHLEPGRYLSLTVTDTGCGMDRETQSRMFDPFFTTKGTGRGLGLSAMLGILRGHRAGLAIESAVGEGSTFRVYLPVLREPTPPSGRARPLRAAISAHGAVVLIAEDEPALRRGVREILTGAGYRVLEAGDGVEAVDVYRRHAAEIGLALLDLHMPLQGGREALAGIRAIDPRARVILTSGFDAHEVLDGLRREDIDFLPKPSSADDLLTAVRTSLSRS